MSPHERNGSRAGDRPSASADDHPPTGRQRRLAWLRLDQRRRWHTGERVRVEDYLREHAWLAGDDELLVDFICHEVLLARECGDGAAWEDAVRRFPRHAEALRSQQELDEALDALGPTVGLGEGRLSRPGAGRPGGEGSLPRVAGYEVLGELGRGGSGVVYEARQRRPNRLVALKMLRPGTDVGPEGLARFQAECEAVAGLQHPNIVQVYEVGEHEGLPFFSMELCPGGSLAQKLVKAPPTPREAAALVEAVAGAVHAAHRAGVVHRDLKPDNVLLAAGGRPKVTDFGLAKRLGGGEGWTRTGAVLGTPSYMAPEQAGGRNAEVGPATDVYALGAVLYALLTGRPPFRATTPLDTALLVLTEEPVSVRRLQPKVPKDLETVCLKCLHKEPKKRYPSAEALAEDLRRFLAGEPIRARPVGPAERLWRWCRRNPAVASLAGAVGALVVLTTAGALVAAARFREVAAQERSAREDAVRATRRAEDSAGAHRRQLVRQYVAGGERLLDEGDYLAALPWLALAERLGRGDEGEDLRRLRLAAVLRHCPVPVGLYAHGRTVHSAHFSADGRRVATASGDGTARVWDARTGEPLTPPLRHEGPVYRASLSPDGRRVVTAGLRQRARVWDVASGKQVFSLSDHGGIVRCGSFSPDGCRVLTAGKDGTARLWDARTGKLLVTLRHAGPVDGASFSPGGRRVLTASEDHTARLWDARTGKPLLPPFTLGGSETRASFSRDGRRLLTTSDDRTVRVWDARTGEAVGPPIGHGGRVRYAGFSPDGRRLATCSGELARVWDVATGAPLTLPLRHRGAAWNAAFSPDGGDLVVVAGDRAYVWDSRTGAAVPPVLRHTGLVGRVSFAPHGRRVVLVGGDQVRVWDLAAGRPRVLALRHGGVVWRGWFSPGGRRVLTASGDGTARLWDSATGRPLTGPMRHGGPVRQAFFGPGGKRVLTAGEDGTARLWDAATGRPLTPPLRHRGALNYACFSPDGRQVATASDDGTARVWNAATGRPLTGPLGHGAVVDHVEFSPDGRWLATGCADESARLWELPGGKERPGRIRPGGWVKHVSFSPDGSALLTVSAHGTARVWEFATGRPRTALLRHAGALHQGEFSPDGRRVLTVSNYQSARLWDASTGEPVTGPLRHGAGVSRAHFSADGRLVVTAGEDGTARVWEARTGAALTPPLRHPDAVTHASFSPDGARVLTSCKDGVARVWELGGPPGRGAAEDMVRRAELLSGHRLDPAGGLIPLDAGALRAEWEALRGEEAAGPPGRIFSGGGDFFVRPGGR